MDLVAERLHLLRVLEQGQCWVQGCGPVGQERKGLLRQQNSKSAGGGGARLC